MGQPENRHGRLNGKSVSAKGSEDPADKPALPGWCHFTRKLHSAQLINRLHRRRGAGGGGGGGG
jgi:hypothetical protein